jgi:amino acid adenylation domain-containing protein
MLQSADCRSIVVDGRAEAQLEVVLAGIDSPRLIILPDRVDVGELRERWPGHTILGARDLAPASDCSLEPVSPDAIAYLLFTSGSTGAPKGVMVSHRNIVHFVSTMVARYGITPDDRFSQMFDHTFDLSVFDMFVAWHTGACVCCPSERVLMNPDTFIRDSRLTIWFSVPSVGVLMKRFGVLKEGCYQSLRWSLFCGEPLPTDVARTWARSAPASVLENLYGPTELTVACLTYRWDPARSPSECRLGIVPIGRPLDGMEAIVVDERLHEVPPGTAGELVMTGPQLTPGYWSNPEATERAYLVPPGKDTAFYRTGDRVFRPVGDGPLTYVGRVDHQIKVSGYRVELGEVEATLRQEPGVETAVALGWPITATGAAGIVAFVTGSNVDPAAIRSNVRGKLQRYAVPHTIRLLSALPHTANGKVDRQALLSLLATQV